MTGQPDAKHQAEQELQSTYGDMAIGRAGGDPTVCVVSAE